jgi:hypothetical protein
MSNTVGRIVLSHPVADVPQVDLAKSMASYKSREQKQLECLERIEQLLIKLADHVLVDNTIGILTPLEDVVTNITPTDTPFLRASDKRIKPDKRR